MVSTWYGRRPGRFALNVSCLLLPTSRYGDRFRDYRHELFDSRFLSESAHEPMDTLARLVGAALVQVQTIAAYPGNHE